MSRGLKPFYKGGPIRSVQALAVVAGVSADEITSVADNIAAHYRPVILRKDDDSIRECWDPSNVLRGIQGRLVSQLLRNVFYPPYLHGSLPKRSYVSNANDHLGAKWCICMDVKSFFPSVAAELVHDAIWQKFFGCSDEVSERLTQLTTLNGLLPQGSLTASYLANLALWRHEPRLVRVLQDSGMTYTRYVDDISISARSYPTPEMKSQCVHETNLMLRLNGLCLKRKKTTVSTSGKGIKIGGLLVGRKVGRSKREREAIATAVLGYEGVAVTLTLKDAQSLKNSLLGTLSELRRFYPREALHLREFLERKNTQQ